MVVEDTDVGRDSLVAMLVLVACLGQYSGNVRYYCADGRSALGSNFRWYVLFCSLPYCWLRHVVSRRARLPGSSNLGVVFWVKQVGGKEVRRNPPLEIWNVRDLLYHLGCI
jgi:hypothetical protein